MKPRIVIKIDGTATVTMPSPDCGVEVLIENLSDKPVHVTAPQRIEEEEARLKR